jgi:uncharacterized protein YaiL (DUF2058 family)
MSASLRDQLLQAGLVNEKQARQAEREQQQQGRVRLPKPQRGLPSAGERAAREAQQLKAARDRQLDRERAQQAGHKARQAQIRQWVGEARLPRVEGEQFYHFVDGKAIRRIGADAAMRERLHRGEIAIVRCDGAYAFVPAAVAARIRACDERAVIAQGAPADPAPAEDGYPNFAVPDDLMW